MHRDQQSRTLLHHAVSTGSKEVVRYLLDHGELCSWAWGVEERLPGPSEHPLPSCSSPRDP
jgi:ankyrin repeat protein